MPSWMYITGSIRLTLYTGVTTDIEQRIFDHKTKRYPGFSAKYHCDRLLYFEEFCDVLDAIAREKQIKGWRREKKLNLIRTMNPRMLDLAAELFPQQDVEAMKEMNLSQRASGAGVLRRAATPLALDDDHGQNANT